MHGWGVLVTVVCGCVERFGHCFVLGGLCRAGMNKVYHLGVC